MNIGFFFAGGVALVAALTHTFVGQVLVVRPLLANSTLPAASKWLHHFCWHITTILLFAMAIVFFHEALNGGHDSAKLMTILAASNAILCLAVAIRGKIRPLRLPALTLFSLTAAAGAIGLLFHF